MPSLPLLSTKATAERLRLKPAGILSLAKRRILPRLAKSKHTGLFNWEHILLILAKLTIWELHYGEARPIGDEILTGPELAQRLGFSLPKIHGLARRRFIPRIRLGGATRYCPAAVRYALDNLISVRKCAKRLGLSRWVLTAMSGPGRTLPVLRLNKRCLRYHWPSVQAALARASAKSTVVLI